MISSPEDETKTYQEGSSTSSYTLSVMTGLSNHPSSPAMCMAPVLSLLYTPISLAISPSPIPLCGTSCCDFSPLHATCVCLQCTVQYFSEESP